MILTWDGMGKDIKQGYEPGQWDGAKVVTED
jgi:hypothetical protein